MSATYALTAETYNGGTVYISQECLADGDFETNCSQFFPTSNILMVFTGVPDDKDGVAQDYLMLNDNVLLGFVMGLQERIDESSMCYQDMSIFIDYVWSSGYAFEFAQYAQTAMAKGKTPTDGGFAVML